MTFKEASEYIENLKGFGINPGLTVIGELCRRLGNPQDKLKFVHIAGTNGKGSVLSFISTILKTAGYRTGRFFSPAVSEYRERIQINNRMISKADFCYYLSLIKDAADTMVADGFNHPTAFELDTTLSFLYFADKKCDIVILETGMGGTLDATNIIKNTLAAVITPIDLDHMDFLGRSISEIAKHKAGIIKPGCLVVSAGQYAEVYDIIRKKCDELGIPLKLSPKNQIGNIRRENPDFKNFYFRQRFSYGNLTDIVINMAGDFQVKNAVTAIDTIEALATFGFVISEKNISIGLREAIWPWRFQLVSSKPPVIVDGAHNADAALKLAETIKIYFTNKRIIYIMGILHDKDYQVIIANTSYLAEHIITITPPGPRGMGSYDLAVEVAKSHPQVTNADSIFEAYELATLLAGKDGVIIAFGSLTFLDILKKNILRKTNG